MNPSLFYLVRHGETDWNQNRLLQGRTDIPLNINGIDQAEELRDHLKDHAFHAVYSSPLQRAYETARIVSEPHGHPIQISPYLQEATYGAFEGLTIEEYHRRKEQLLANQIPLTPDHHLHFKPVPDAESAFEIYQRALAFFEETAAKHPNKTVLIFTHGAFMRAILFITLKLHPSQVKVPNTSYFVAKKDTEQLSIVSYRGIEIL